MSQSLSRRRFIQTSTAVSALAVTSRTFSANDVIALGIIGCGGRAQRLLKAITNIKAFRVAALCDLKEERALQAAEICSDYKPAVKTYTDLHKMLANEKLDACIVATEEGNHAKCAIPVLEAGLHCFSEKPMDVTVEKVNQLTETARKAKGIYQVGFQRRYAPSFQQCIGHLHEGGLGKITFMQGMWQWAEDVGGRYLNLEESGGWFLAQACHHCDVMGWIMKDQAPLSCVAMGQITVPRNNVFPRISEDHSALSFEFPGGAIFSYTHLMNCCEQFSGEKLWVYAEKGGMDLRLGMKYPLKGQGEPVKIGAGVSDWDEGTYEELEAFARHVQNNEKPLSNEETARISTLIGIMGRTAMYNWDKNRYEPSVVTWDDLKAMA